MVKVLFSPVVPALIATDLAACCSDPDAGLDGSVKLLVVIPVPAIENILVELKKRPTVFDPVAENMMAELLTPPTNAGTPEM